MKPFVMGVLARTKVVLVKKILVSMICKCRRILCFFFFFFFSVFFFLFFSIYLQNQKIDKKIWAYPRRKAVYLVISCQYIFIVFSFFSLGMLWWTAVNLYSSCKLIVRKLYRFLYFGRKVFFLCNKRFPILASYPLWAVSLFTQYF